MEGASTKANHQALEAFTTGISRPRLSPLYTAGVAVVAFAMVLLPAIYIALILLAGWGVLYHLTHNLWIFNGSGGGILRLIFYLGPAVAGGILIFFMLKPLFARRTKRAELPSLDPEKEPLLFAFVQRVCELVHAPMPSRIDIDCQVNASASLRKGLWSRDLVLTIGLPLAAGLGMRQFAGVLAHEFGHFAQGAGMRLTYVIRNINFWFARVVFERDKWDQQLEHSAKRVDFRVGIMLHAARGCVWLTRRILWALMHAGTAISCFMLRQMEYDADSYESKVAGSDAFESTAARLRELNVATQMAVENVRQSWAANRLPENLPLLINHKAGSLPVEVRKQLADRADTSKTGWFDTHPCDADRVRAARALGEPGVFRLESPAAELFTDFAETSKVMTRHHYKQNWKLEFSAENLVSSDEMLRESAANSEAGAAIRSFYGGVNINLTPLLIGAGIPPLSNREEAVAEWRKAREKSGQLRSEAEKASNECLQQQELLIQFTSAWHLNVAGFKIEPKEFGLPESAATVMEQEASAKLRIKDAANAINEKTKSLMPFITALGARLSLALQLARQAADPTGAAALEIENLIQVLAAVGATVPNLHKIGTRLNALNLLAKNYGNHSNPERVGTQMTRLAAELRKLGAEVRSLPGNLAYPFPHPGGQLTIAEYARYEKPCKNEWEAAFQEGNSQVERMFALHHRLLGRLLVIAAMTEKELERSGPIGRV